MSKAIFNPGSWQCPKCGSWNQLRGNYLSKLGKQQLIKRCKRWECNCKVLLNVTISRKTYEHTYTKVYINGIVNRNT